MPGPTLELNSNKDFAQTEIVRAGAGAGKTTALTDKVLEFTKTFYSRHGRWPRIVVTTFTRKATEELRERLLKDAKDNKELIEYVSSGRSLLISTIHGVLARFLRQYAHLLELDSNFTVIKRPMALRRELKLLRDILSEKNEFHELLRHFSVRDLSDSLSASVEAAIFHPNPQPVKISDLLNSRDQRLQTVNGHFLEVVESALAECQIEKWRSVLENYRDLSLKLEAGYDPAILFAIAEIEKPKFIKKSAPFSEDLNEDLKAALAQLAELQTQAHQTPALQEFARLSGIFSELREIYVEKFDKIIRETGQLEMRDLERLAMAAVDRAPAVAQAFAGEWDYWLIDEFQDTSPLQVRLLRALIGSTPAYYVGDPQQSIYLFRGARREVFQQQEEAIERSGGKRSELTKNYRSNPSLLLFFNDVFAELGEFMRMEPKEAPSGAPNIATYYQFEKGSDAPYESLVRHIARAIKHGDRPDSFCVLARRNSELLEIARALEQMQIPTYLHSGGRFYERREVVDILSILKFLLNPHDNVNLVRLLRSPWFFVADTEIARVAAGRPSQYWSAFLQKLREHPSIAALNEYRLKLDSIGTFECLRAIIIERGLIDFAAAHDATGVKEANIWKFLSILREAERTPGFQYLQFVNDALRADDDNRGGDEDSDAVAAIEPNRVNLMTIHKSKGLKFKHVILPNLHKRARLSDERGHESGFIMNEDSGLYSIALKMLDEDSGKFKRTHSLYACQVLEEFSRRERQELDRLFYVAMTRAVESVVLHGAQPESGSVAEKLSKIFTLGKHRTNNYSFEVLAEWPPAEAMTRPAFGAIQVRPAFTQAETTREQSRRWSVTELVEEHMAVLEAGNAPAADISADKKNQTPSQLRRQLELPVWGQKLHSYFERLKYKSDEDPKDYFSKWFGSGIDRFLKAAEFTLNLQDPPVRRLIDSGHVEWGFQFKSERGIVEGQIDLWGTIDGTTWLVDYKSGSSQYKEKAFYQLGLYSQALRAFGVTGLIRGAVIYSLDGQVAIRDM